MRKINLQIMINKLEKILICSSLFSVLHLTQTDIFNPPLVVLGQGVLCCLIFFKFAKSVQILPVEDSEKYLYVSLV